MTEKLNAIFNGAYLFWIISAGIVGIGVNMYSDLQMLKADSVRLSAVYTEQASVKADVRVLETTVKELRENVIYLNTNLKEATDRMTEILIKLEKRTDDQLGKRGR